MSPRLRDSLSASLPEQNGPELPLTDTFVASVMRVPRPSLLLMASVRLVCVRT